MSVRTSISLLLAYIASLYSKPGFSSMLCYLKSTERMLFGDVWSGIARRVALYFWLGLVSVPMRLTRPMNRHIDIVLVWNNRVASAYKDRAETQAGKVEREIFCARAAEPKKSREKDFSSGAALWLLRSILAPSFCPSLSTMTHLRRGAIALGTLAVLLLAAHAQADPCVLKPTFGNAFIGKPEQYALLLSFALHFPSLGKLYGCF